MVPQASEKCCLLPPEHQQIGCCTSNSLNSEQVPGTFIILMTPSLPLQTSYRAKKTLVTPFSCFQVPHTLELDEADEYESDLLPCPPATFWVSLY